MEKEKWDPDFSKRQKIKEILDSLIPQFSVRLGGATSIDVTKPGIDKAYGIGKLRDILGISLQEMIFVGDALFPGGNDYPAKEAGVVSIPIRDPDETKRVIETIIAFLGADDQRRPLGLVDESVQGAPRGNIDGAPVKQSLQAVDVPNPGTTLRR